MTSKDRLKNIAIGSAALAFLLVGCTSSQPSVKSASASPASATPAAPPPATVWSGQLNPVVAMRRMSEAQYRNAIADIFGPDIQVAGRFEPIMRPVHDMIATGAMDSAVSPAGLEQLDAIARNIATQVFDTVHRGQFVHCTPKDEKAADPECASQVLTPLGRYIFRRPLTSGEQTAYVKIASDAATQTGSFYKGLELSLASILVSPNFIYIMESGEPDPAHPGELRLDNFSRASRLSFLLWNTTPNETLLKAAEEGRLTDQAQLAAIAAKMTKSPRLEQGVRAFLADMLMFEKFDDLTKDSIVYPRYNPEVAQALPEQTLRMAVDLLVTRNGDYRELFTTNKTFVNRALGTIYNVQVHKPSGWEAIEFAPNDDRAGILGEAGFLSNYSHSGRSSPTLRGRAIRELLLCQPVPNPPGNVNFTAVQDITNKAMPTARIRFGAHITDGVCAGCHKITDPIGLSLERFDGIGAFRATENEAPIDASGDFEGTPYQGASGLGKAIAANKASTTCVAGRALEYATGRSNETNDNSTLITSLEQLFASDGYRIPALFLRVATMPEAYRVMAKPLESGPPKVASVAN